MEQPVGWNVRSRIEARGLDRGESEEAKWGTRWFDSNEEDRTLRTFQSYLGVPGRLQGTTLVLLKFWFLYDQPLLPGYIRILLFFIMI